MWKAPIMNNYEQYILKDPSYYASKREDLFRIISSLGTFDSVLDVGCGIGTLLKDLKYSGIAEKITGIEANNPPENYSEFDAFYTINIEDSLDRIRNAGDFDLIIFADVLEHLIDPWSLLTNLVNLNLRSGGRVVISLPNFRNVFTLSQIIFKNSFKYSVDGVLDKTHLRFFCLKDMLSMVSLSGLQKEMLVPNYKYKDVSLFRKNRLKTLNTCTLNLFPFWIADQVTIVARKPTHGCQ